MSSLVSSAYYVGPFRLVLQDTGTLSVVDATDTITWDSGKFIEVLETIYVLPLRKRKNINSENKYYKKVILKKRRHIFWTKN